MPDMILLEPNVVEALHEMLFALPSTHDDVNRWLKQGFSFYDAAPLRFGLCQTAGGPCGVLAVVQAFVIRRLLSAGLDTEDILTPSDDQRSHALVGALADILLGCRPSDDSPLFVLTTRQAYNEGFIEYYPAKDEFACFEFLTANISKFSGELGVVLFVFSCILTRTLTLTESDRDDLSQPLVQRFGHTSQDLVNLLLCGKAVANIHDGDKFIGGQKGDPNAWALKGVHKKVPCGYLTSLEALRYARVGEFYKNPLYPIWVIGSASHYSVVWSFDSRVGKISESEERKVQFREKFNQLDPLDNGFIPIQNLGELLTSLDLCETTSDLIMRYADPDDMGIIIWSRFWALLEEAERKPPIPQSNWSCPVCTYRNIHVVEKCDMCGTEAPPPPQAKESKEPSVFKMYHYNGITNHKACKAKCTSISITVPDPDVLVSLGPQGHSDVVGLCEVLQTRWPGAIVDYGDEIDPVIT